MKEPERNRRGMQQRSGLLATISERSPPASVSPELAANYLATKRKIPTRACLLQRSVMKSQRTLS
jgi:hypothetical protein